MGQVAIVTGSASGIGKATAKLFAKEGAKLTISDINKEAGQKVVEEIKSFSFKCIQNIERLFII